ncbi:hypothetical protein GOP47_0022832 [Adiantum capillus-veneris]|uniref:MADS-box domain-containing protein n=1 Tax=Adiantum capillus-veneris TaxID=13818 RepID=A0A9D4U6B9_ADICA|nr:hypothetical protein GOP47_0022832 [Adiantum capillus-veneris]
MGRKKLEIKARETKEGKQVTFSKRRMGVEKKAQELATLCDIPLLLLLFSPNKRLSWISGSHGTPEELLKSFAEIPFQERSRRKMEVLEQLNRAFKKSNHEIDVQSFSQFNSATQNMTDCLSSLHHYKAKLLQKLSDIECPTTIEDASRLEQILQIRLHEIEMHKANQPLPSYNQVHIEEKALALSRQLPVFCNESYGPAFPTSEHFMVPHDDPIGESPSWMAQSSRSIDAPIQEAWETEFMPTICEQESSTFLHDQEASIFWIPNTMDPIGHNSTYLDASYFQATDANEQNANVQDDGQRNDNILPTKDGSLCTSRRNSYDKAIS